MKQNSGIEVIQGSPSASTALTYALMREMSRSSARTSKSTSLRSRQLPSPPQISSHDVMRTHSCATSIHMSEASCETSIHMSEASTVQVNNQESKKLSEICMPPKQLTADKSLLIAESKDLTVPRYLMTKQVESSSGNKTDATELSTSDDGSTGKTEKKRKKKIFGSVRSLLRRNSSSKTSNRMAAKEKATNDDAPYDELQVPKDDVPYDETINTAPASTPTFDSPGRSPHSTEKGADDNEGTSDKTKLILKKAKLYLNKSKQILSTLEQECKNNPPKGEQDEEAEREKRMKDLKCAKLALGYAREAQRLYDSSEFTKAKKGSVFAHLARGYAKEAQRLYDSLESTKAKKGNVAIDSSPERAHSPLSGILAELRQQPPAAPNQPAPMERGDDAPADISTASPSCAERVVGSENRVPSTVTRAPSKEEVESIVSNNLTESKELVIMERKHHERKMNTPQLCSLSQEFMKCGSGLKYTTSSESEEFYVNTNTTDQEYDRMIEELEHYPPTCTASKRQPVKDEMKAAAAPPQERMDMSSSSVKTGAACSQELAFPRVISKADTFEVQHLDCVALTMNHSSANDSESDNERDKYHVDHVDEFSARSAPVTSDGSFSEAYEEIEVIHDGSEVMSQYGSDTSHSEAGFAVPDEFSEFTPHYESDASSGEIDDSDYASEATSRCESDSSCSELQEEIETIHESDYSDESSKSRYSTCSSDSSEVTLATTMSETIAREIRTARNFFGFSS